MAYQGIDYGRGTTNVDVKTGIRYGVISQHSLNSDVIYEIMNEGADYGDPTCPECTGPLHETSSDCDCPEDSKFLEKDYHCPFDKESFWSERCFSEKPHGWSYDKDGYQLSDCLDSDVFVLASPFYTYAQFCSPCVPGAGNLDSSIEPTPEFMAEFRAEFGHEPARIYCLGHDWFEGGKAPYRVFRVVDNSEV